MPSLYSSARTIRADDYTRQPSVSQNSSIPQNNNANSNASDPVETFSQRVNRTMKPWIEMEGMEKWGLAGLIAQMNISEDQAALARGQDLTQLGLDLNSSEPLHPTFATPFSAPQHTRPLDTDYHIPQCYQVANVKPLQERWGAMSDETLLYIFYDKTLDIAQMEASDELYRRKWRWYIVDGMWITKDESSGPPVVAPDQQSERGRYWVHDPNIWKRYKVCLSIVYLFFLLQRRNAFLNVRLQQHREI